MNIKKYLKSNEYAKHLLAIFTGTALAQLVPLLISPILTRLYSPELFGLFASFIAISAITGSIVSLRYDVAIALPKREKHAYSVAHIAIMLIILNTIICLFSLLLLRNNIENLFNEDALIWILLICVTTFFIGANQVVSYLSNRDKLFYDLAKNRLFQSLTISAAQLGLFFFIPHYGLALGFILGLCISTYNLYSITLRKKILLTKTTQKRLYKKIAIKYRNFPIYDTPTVLLNTAVNQLPTILFSILFSPTIAGFYYLTQRVLQAPINLISSSVLEVFKEKAARDYRTTGNASHIYKQTLMILITISALPSLLLYFFIIDIFTYVFGVKWAVAGEYAQIMLPALFLRFIANPLSFMIYIAQKQKVNLIIMLLMFLSTIIAFYYYSDPISIIKFQTLAFCIMYIVHITFSAYLAGIKLRSL